MTAAIIEPYRIAAFNTAHDSENKIHDDATARRFGFGGGLVPGVDVYGYMSHLPVMRWGRAWLERGTAECRFFKPVYDGDIATVAAVERDGELEITVESRGEVCAGGRAALPERAPPLPALDEFLDAPQRRQRPPADEASLPVGAWLGLDPYEVTAEMAARYLADSHESAAIYAAEGLLHPRDILRTANFVISRNVQLGPWIHTASRIRHLAAVTVGSTCRCVPALPAITSTKGTALSKSTRWRLPTGRCPSPASRTPRSICRARSRQRSGYALSARAAATRIYPGCALPPL